MRLALHGLEKLQTGSSSAIVAGVVLGVTGADWTLRKGRPCPQLASLSPAALPPPQAGPPETQ